MKYALVLAESDNVGNVVDDVEIGDTVLARSKKGTETTVKATEKVPFFFKIAIKPIPAVGDILKYGEVIGKAAIAIEPGACVHIHNVEGKRGRGDLKGGNS